MHAFHVFTTNAPKESRLSVEFRDAWASETLDFQSPGPLRTSDPVLVVVCSERWAVELQWPLLFFLLF